jgi:hypothetical protein
MATVTKVKANNSAQINIRPTPEDQKLVAALHRKLGVDTSQIFRLAIRVLATKEGVTA